ncbi:MAG: extensin family protein [Deltaproteobacteria bacterium]
MYRVVRTQAMARHEDPFLSLSTAMSVSIILAGLALGLASHFGTFRFLKEISPSAVPAPPLAPDKTDRERSVQSENALPSGGWSMAEIIQAREACMQALRSIAADVTFLDPVKTDRCGIPAPVLINSLGSDPKLVFDPPITTNCRLMTALADWNKRFLQPAALKTFRSTVSTIVGASSYACRNVYGLPTGNLSQHAFGNAIDIGAFELANERVVTVLQGWGPTERDIEERKKQERQKLRTAISAKSADLPGTGRIEISKLKTREVGLKPLPMDRPVTGSDQPSSPAAKPSPPASEMTFLRSLRSGACGPFATVLGPESNEVHRNHLHFDLNPMRHDSHCD